MRDTYDVIVIGGGHAGVEAAWAALGALAHGGSRGFSGEGRVALITMDPARIGQMSCNPAIGGLGKGQIVREVDALGGLMGLAIDATGIMFKMLNTSRGAAVHGPRAQADKYAYAAEVQRLISTRSNIDILAGTVDEIMVEDGCVVGVILSSGAQLSKPDTIAVDWNLSSKGQARPIFLSPLPLGEGLGEGRTARTVHQQTLTPNPSPKGRGEQERLHHATMIRAGAVVLTTGTFMRGLMHTGETQTHGGRVDEGSATGISATLRNLGFELGRLKTGTPPRLAVESIDWNGLPPQVGDDDPTPFSDLSPMALPAGRFPHLPQAQCRITSTTAQAHELIRANLDRAPIFSGQLEADCGPRYCPSIEDKVVRFAERDSHHVFLEPESLHTNEIYCNGISTSLPTDIQQRIVRMMPGCEKAEVLRWGYAVEYDMVWPHQIDSTCMTKSIRGLFFAGQINCTTGYEEAAGQGLIAGLNAARLAHGDDPVRLQRDQAYIGVMLDDLVTKTPREPYRMFTSRAEHRLLLRADNADDRLTALGRGLGLVDEKRWKAYERRQEELNLIRDRFDRLLVDGKTLREIARRPETTGFEVAAHLEYAFDARLIERVITEARYDGYIARQRAEIKRQSKAEGRSIPNWVEFESIAGLRNEAAQVMAKFRPTTMGQAGRLSGVNPADLTLLAVAIRRGPIASAADTT